MFDQSILYIIIFALLVLLFVLFRTYSALQKKLIALTSQNQYMKSQGIAENEKVLEGIHSRALIIIDEANKKAAQIITQAKTMDTQGHTFLQQKAQEAATIHAAELKKASESLLALYKEALQSIQKNDINLATNISKSIESSAQQEIAKFGDTLAQQTIASEKIVEGRVQAEYQKIEADLKVYKEARLSEIDGEILQIIQTVTENILKKHLSVDDQRELVLESLNEAKRQVRV